MIDERRPGTAPSRPALYAGSQHRALIREAAESLARSATHLRCTADCVGYHRGWMLLQSLGLISGLFSERAFIVEAIRAFGRRRPVRSVHIAGSADFGLLSVVHEALGHDIDTVRVFVSDRCETPLSLCRLYASRAGFAIECERLDLHADPAPGRFDLVLTHSLLSFCGPAERGPLLARLAQGLDHEGLLLVYQSIRPDAEPRTLAYGDDEVDAMIGQALEVHRAAEPAPPWSEAELAQRLREFCRAKTTTSVHSAQAVLDSARAHGLSVRHHRLLFDSAASSHRAATPKSHHLKYEFGFGLDND